MFQRPRADEEKTEIKQENIAEDFSEFSVLLRKSFWLILKSLVIPPQLVMTQWLTEHAGEHLEYYKSLEIKFKRFFTDDFLNTAKEIFESVDTVTLMTDSQTRLFISGIEPRIYLFFECNPDFFSALIVEFTRENAQLLLLAKDFLEYLEALTNGNLLLVEGYFSMLNKDLRETLWKAISAPFNDDTRQHAADWINDGFGRKYNAYVEALDARLRIILHGKIVEYLEALNAISRPASRDPEEKIYQFMANNYDLFLFLQAELDKPDSTLMKILREYFDFLSIPVNSPLYTLRSEYDFKHSGKNIKEDKDTARLRNLGIFANPADFSRLVNVRSIGLDGCLFHSAYYSSYRTDKLMALVNTNKDFFSHLMNSIQDDYKEVIFINGSLRQSWPADEFCCVTPVEHGVIMSESCFSAMQSIVMHTVMATGKSCRLDDYLLVDSFQNLVEGATMHDAIRKMAEPNFESKLLAEICVNDKSKILLLYAQIHKLAANYKNDLVQFDFYSGDPGELLNIHIFFINNRELKPRNVFLNLYLYNPRAQFNANAVELKYQIGDYQSGAIDFDYRANLEIMVDCCDLKNYAEPQLSPTDDKRNTPLPKSRNTHLETNMPATMTLDVNTTFNALAFRQKRISTVSERVARETSQEQKTATMPLAKLR